MHARRYHTLYTVQLVTALYSLIMHSLADLKWGLWTCRVGFCSVYSLGVTSVDPFLAAAAMVLQGPRHIRVKHGMNFTIPCEVGGEPGPKAMVVAAITGVHKPGPALYSSQAGVRPDTTFWYNRTVSSKNYPKHYAFTVQCIASNMIVNPPDGVTIKYSMWNTKISINP